MVDLEVWKPIPGRPGYEASSHGRIRSLDRWIADHNGRRLFLRGRTLKQVLNADGYPVVGGLGYVHRAVMLSFNGPPANGFEVAHNDGNPANNLLTNLRYDTHAGYHADRLTHGTHGRGANAKLTAYDVIVIRSVIGETTRALAKRYGVSDACIRLILIKRRWRWL